MALTCQVCATAPAHNVACNAYIVAHKCVLTSSDLLAFSSSFSLDLTSQVSVVNSHYTIHTTLYITACCTPSLLKELVGRTLAELQNAPIYFKVVWYICHGCAFNMYQCYTVTLIAAIMCTFACCMCPCMSVLVHISLACMLTTGDTSLWQCSRCNGAEWCSTLFRVQNT
jgi:hypothetical protein